MYGFTKRQHQSFHLIILRLLTMEYCILRSTLPPNSPSGTRPSKQSRSTVRHPSKRQSFPANNSFILNSGRESIADLVDFLQQPSGEASPETIKYFANTLRDLAVFPEFSNDIKVLGSLLENLKIRQVKQKEPLFRQGGQSRCLFRVVRGQFLTKKPSSRTSKFKAESDLVQQPEDQLSGNIEAFAKTSCTLLQIEIEDYSKAQQIYNRRKKIRQMLEKTSLFSELRRKELSFMLEKGQELALRSKQVLFREGEDSMSKFFFIVEGDITVLKENCHKSEIVCTLSSGSLVGEQVLFDQGKRTYTASALFSPALVLVASKESLEQTLEHFKISRERVISSGYRNYLQMKLAHYNQKIADSVQIKEGFHQVQRQVRSSPIKQKQILNILHDIQNNSNKLELKEKLMEKKYQLSIQRNKEAHIITVDKPLFTRQECPGLKKIQKRAHIVEHRVREGWTLPSLH